MGSTVIASFGDVEIAEGCSVNANAGASASSGLVSRAWNTMNATTPSATSPSAPERQGEVSSGTVASRGASSASGPVPRRVKRPLNATIRLTATKNTT